MQNEANTTAPAATPAIVAVAATPATPATPAPKAARKPAAPKAATPAVEAQPVAAKPVSTYADERAAAAIAVAAFYSGASLPFKAASAKLSDLNPANPKKPSVRTAALVAAMLAYAPSGTFDKRGHFTRGAFRVPARLLDPKAKADAMLAAMPESGCLGNMLGRVVKHISGPVGGKNARDGIFALDFAAARVELQQLGDATAKPALAVLAKLAA
jgi:hypothetical protein